MLDDYINKDNLPQAIDINNLAKHHGQRLYYFVLHKVRNEEDAQDIVQSTYIEAIKSSQNFRQESKPETWLMGIALNLIKNQFYKRKLKPTYYLADEEENVEQTISYETPDCILEQKQLIRNIQNIFNTMPDDMRLTAEKVLLQGSTYQEATIISPDSVETIPIGTVRSRVARARQMLRNLQEYYEIDD